MDHSVQISEYVSQFLSQLGNLAEVTVSVSLDPESSIYHIGLQTSQPALLIGFHGETISAFQLFLSIHLNQLLGEKVTISVNVNDYKERRQTSIETLANAAVAQVKATGKPHSLPPMSPAERRLVHMYLADSTEVVTASDGEGRERSVIISPKA